MIFERKKNFKRPTLEDLKSVFGNDVFSQRMMELHVLRTLEKNWEKLVGKTFLYNSWPTDFNQGRLKVIIAHDSYRMELEFLKAIFFRNANSLFPDSVIEHWSFRLGNPMSGRKIPEKKKPNFTGKDDLLKIAENEKDDEFRKKLIELIGLF